MTCPKCGEYTAKVRVYETSYQYAIVENGKLGDRDCIRYVKEVRKIECPKCNQEITL